jgi:hypothetical protein
VHTATINASDLGLALAVRKSQLNAARRGQQYAIAARWCVMSAGHITNDCRRHHTSYQIALPSMAAPMSRGTLYRVIERVRATEGTHGFRRVFGIGVRAALAENLHTLEA